MAWQRFEVKGSWQGPPFYKRAPDEAHSEYDFHAFSLEIKDVIWAWAFAGGVLLLLVLLIFL